MYKVVVDIAPRIIDGTSGCHQYVFDRYKTKREAEAIKWQINSSKGDLGVARVEKEKADGKTLYDLAEAVNAMIK